MRSLLRLLAGLVLLAAAGCDEGTPVAPTGSILRISATPDRISSAGTATITVIVAKANGVPVNPGTEVRLSTTLGSIPAVAETDAAGVATAQLTGDGRVGTATVSASSGSAEPVTVDVAIGSLAASLSLQATPSSVPITGGQIELLALVRDDQGQPLPDASVNFLTEVGTLESGGSFLVSDQNGEVRDTLTLTEANLQTISGDDFDVTAEVAGSGGSIITKAFTVRIQRPPEASFTFSRSDLTVVFTDTSTGNPTSWQWDFGDGTPISTAQNPAHTYSVAGTYVVTLTARNAQGSSSVSQLVSVSVS